MIDYDFGFPEGIHLNQKYLDFIQPGKSSPLADGSTETVLEPRSYWIGQWQTLFLKGSDIGKMRAWLASLANGANPFWAEDLDLCGVYANLDLSNFLYRGTSSIYRLANSRQVSIRVRKGFKLIAGDRFEIRSREHHALVQVERSVEQTNSQNPLEIVFRPALPVGHFKRGDTLDFGNRRVRMILKNKREERRGADIRFMFEARSVA